VLDQLDACMLITLVMEQKQDFTRVYLVFNMDNLETELNCFCPLETMVFKW
jgi:hypothetical protein